MIISKLPHASIDNFEQLLSKSAQKLIELNKTSTLDCSGVKLEKILFKILTEVSTNSPFDNTYEMTSKLAFPDIVSKIKENNWLGIEVKTSQKDWKCFGNSIFESTRDPNVSNIYMFFARINDFDVRWDKYENVLETINITHSPRYTINMDNAHKGFSNVFEIMGISYDDFRNANTDEKMELVRALKRSQYGEDISLWWLSSEEGQSDEQYKFKLLEDLDVSEKDKLIAECLVRFPEIFGPTSPGKYKGAAKWMLSEKGIASSSFRDTFSAGGKVLISQGDACTKAPQVYDKLTKHPKYIMDAISIFAAEQGEPPEITLKRWAFRVDEMAASVLSEDFPTKKWLLNTLSEELSE